MTSINHDVIQESLVELETLGKKLCNKISELVEAGEIVGDWDKLSSCFENKSKVMVRLEAHNTLMRTTLELALECFEMNGLGKGYAMDVIRDTLREVARGEE